ncbi:acetate/propionate family kinase [Hyphococcus sp.]|uniref:acetate/propionate family kinase n=1 Tax=Hyphococcus sp. TaxID=2038636 RepID=UPI0035C780A9
MSKLVVTLNAGSSSIKTAVYKIKHAALDETPLLRASVSGIGGEGECRIQTAGEPDVRRPFRSSGGGHDDAWNCVFEAIDAGLAKAGYSPDAVNGVGHRIVHGGAHYCKPERLEDATLEALAALCPLAPGHQPYNLDGVSHAQARWPEASQIACFDTAFHRSQPRIAQLFALPRQYEADGVIRYGFHGLSYDYIAQAAPEIVGPAATERMIVAHLGAGASLCALREGRSVATTMGFTALDGLPMATRSGAIDPGVLIYLMQQRKMDAAAISDLLYNQSGLLGLSVVSGDMRVLLESDSKDAAEAVDYFVYHCIREIGALAGALGGVDTLVFTAGVGENAAAIRAAILDGLGWLGFACDHKKNNANGPLITTRKSAASAWVIPTNEELMIARSVANLAVDGF